MCLCSLCTVHNEQRKSLRNFFSVEGVSTLDSLLAAWYIYRMYRKEGYGL